MRAPAQRRYLGYLCALVMAAVLGLLPVASWAQTMPPDQGTTRLVVSQEIVAQPGVSSYPRTFTYQMTALDAVSPLPAGAEDSYQWAMTGNTQASILVPTPPAGTTFTYLLKPVGDVMEPGLILDMGQWTVRVLGYNSPEGLAGLVTFHQGDFKSAEPGWTHHYRVEPSATQPSERTGTPSNTTRPGTGTKPDVPAEPGTGTETGLPTGPGGEVSNQPGATAEPGTGASWSTPTQRGRLSMALTGAVVGPIVLSGALMFTMGTAFLAGKRRRRQDQAFERTQATQSAGSHGVGGDTQR